MHKKIISLLLCLCVSAIPCLPAAGATGATTGATGAATGATGTAASDVPTKKAESQKAVSIREVKNMPTGVRIQWKRVTGIDGYYVFRRIPGENWQKLTDIIAARTIQWTDTTAKNGVLYEYMVVSYKRFRVAGVTVTKTIPVRQEESANTPGTADNPSSEPDEKPGSGSGDPSPGQSGDGQDYKGEPAGENQPASAGAVSGSDKMNSDGNGAGTDHTKSGVNGSGTDGAEAGSYGSGADSTNSEGNGSDADSTNSNGNGAGLDHPESGSNGSGTDGAEAGTDGTEAGGNGSGADSTGSEGNGSGLDHPESGGDGSGTDDAESGSGTSDEDSAGTETVTVTRIVYPLPENARIGYRKLTEPIVSGTTAAACRLEAPVLKKVTMQSKTVCRVKWQKKSGISGYLLQYAPNRIFAGAKTIRIPSAAVTSQKIKNLNPKKTWYVRICTYKTFKKSTRRSAWTACSGAKKSSSLKVSRLKKGSKVLELRTASAQSMYGYDTVQGSCCDGLRSYHVLHNKTKKNCIIVRMNLATKKIEKKSAALPIHHGNDITFNSDTGKLIVVHLDGKPLRLTEIDPTTLKITANHDVKIPASLFGASSSKLKKITAFSGVAYDTSENRYVVRIRHSKNFLVLDPKFWPLRYITNTCPDSYTNQGIECTGDYIICAQSPSDKNACNALVILDWDGNYIARIRLSGISEFESTYLHRGVLYGNTYQSGRRYVTIKKTIPVKQKKKINGKVKTVTVTKTISVRVKKLFRDNHIFRLTSF